MHSCRLGILRGAAWALFVCLSTVPAARAQTPLSSTTARELDLRGSVFTGYDTDLTGQQREMGQPSSASHVGGLLSLNYDVRSPNRTFYTTAVSEYRHYRADQVTSTPMGFGSAGLSTNLSRRLRLDATVQAGYSPQFQFSLLPPTTDVPSEQPVPTLDYGLTSYDVVSYQGSAGISLRLDGRSSIRLGYGNGRYAFIGQGYELKTQSVQGGYYRTLTRYAEVRVGYAEQEGRYFFDDAAPSRVRRIRIIDAGVNYARPLSLSRRTSIAFSSGSYGVDYGDRTHYSLTGGARLNHAVSRFWNLGIAYVRRVGMEGGFDEPVFADAVNANLSGVVRRRVSVGASVGYSNGQVGLASSGNYDSVQANARIETPLTRRRMSLFGSYFYYRHFFDQSVNLPPGVAPRYGRHGVRAGLTVAIL